MAAGSLDRRTVLLSAALALVIAAIAGVIGWSLLSHDDPGADSSASGELTLDGQQIPVDQVDLQTVDGKTTSLAELAGGKAALVNLWQSSCNPCVKEMPLLESASKEHPELAFVGIATQDRVAEAKKLADQTGITYPWALDPQGDFFYAAKGTGMPTTLLVSADGTILASHTGWFRSSAQLEAFLGKGD